MRSWAPDLAARAAAGAPPGTTVIGIDEDTAIVDLSGGGRSWQVHGRQQAWILTSGQDPGTGQGDGAGQDGSAGQGDSAGQEHGVGQHSIGQAFPAGANMKFDLYK
jgi:hypothetical protein